MSNFTIFQQAVTNQLAIMEAKGFLFVTSATKDELWDTYMGAWPEGSNPIFRERTEHDCNCCKQFIRNLGNAVSYSTTGELITVWDKVTEEPYATVAKAMGDLVRSKVVISRYFNDSNSVGTKSNLELNEAGNITWNHFYHKLTSQHVIPKAAIASRKGKGVNNFKVLKRSLEEISLEAVEVVEELIDSKNIYRGEEHKHTISTLKKCIKDYRESTSPEAYLWYKSDELGQACAFKNTVIGTLLMDLSEGKGLEGAVKSFEDKVAPHNYKRPKALITQAMIDKAEAAIEELNLGDALERRHAVTEDITVNNVLFADRAAKKRMGALSGLTPTKADSVNEDSLEEMGIEDFISNIVPKADTIEMMVSNQLQNNLMSLVAPVHADAPSMLKWDNNFTWSYKGEATDSAMRENVKAAGGNVDGVLRFSIQWNTPDMPHASDLDAHCTEPNGNTITYSNMRSHTSGTLDVDITDPRNKVAVENIIYTDINQMPDGVYVMKVHTYAKRAGTGFTAEVEVDGVIHSFDYPKATSGKIEVAQVIKKGSELKVVPTLDSSQASREVWNVETNQFKKVSLMMLSPNHWDEQTTGNKHYFFILDKCKNPDDVRGFYNEFLSDSLRDHRKVFEVLSSKMKVAESDEQLSGLGFSSTQRNSCIVKVRGDYNRNIKINF